MCMSTVVITGGNGFIGKHIATQHLNKGDHVCVIDNYSTSIKPTNLHTTQNLTAITYDLSNTLSDQIKRTIREADLVYHLASSVGVKHIDDAPGATLRNSMSINNNMFPLFEKYQSRVIFASTSEVYGNVEHAKETDDLKIGSPDTMRWGYACGKLMSEFLLKTYSFPSTIARFFNVTGRGQLSDHGMVLPTFIERASRGDDIVIHGTGKQYRSFCDVRDAIGMLDVITGDAHIGEIYNIGSSTNVHTIKELAEKVIILTESTSDIIYKRYDECFSDQFGDIYKRAPNTDKINKFYTARYSLDDIILNMYER